MRTTTENYQPQLGHVHVHKAKNRRHSTWRPTWLQRKKRHKEKNKIWRTCNDENKGEEETKSKIKGEGRRWSSEGRNKGKLSAITKLIAFQLPASSLATRFKNSEQNPFLHHIQHLIWKKRHQQTNQICQKAKGKTREKTIVETKKLKAKKKNRETKEKEEDNQQIRRHPENKGKTKIYKATKQTRCYKISTY